MREFAVICYEHPKEGSFTLGRTYVLHEERMNDIVFYCCEDDTGTNQSFHEKSWSKYFKPVL